MSSNVQVACQKKKVPRIWVPEGPGKQHLHKWGRGGMAGRGGGGGGALPRAWLAWCSNVLRLHLDFVFLKVKF